MILWWTVEANKSLRAMTKWVDNVGDYRIDCGGEGVKGLFWSITFIYVGFMPTVSEGWESFHIGRFWVLNRNTSKNENIFRQQGQNKLAEMFLQQKSTVTPFDKHTKMELLWMWPSLEKHKNVLQRRGKGFLFQSQYRRLDETLKIRVSLSSPQKLVFFKISQRRGNF